MNLIDVKNLLFKYKMYSGEKEEVIEHTAIDNISLSIKKGDFVGILGHNGSGKSTLAKQLAALLKPSGGVIYVGGMDTAKEEQILDIRKTAGLVFQNPDNQLIGNIVEEDVAFGPENMGIPAEEIEMRITKALASTGMTAYREASPGALSGGQKQKIAISGVLAMEPECIIFDEPTAMIDPESRKELLEAIYDLKRLKNITVIYITHFLQEVSQADYLYIMSHGKITLEGAPETLFKMPEKLAENNLELPFEVALIDNLRKKSVDVPEEIYTKQQLLEFLKYHFQKDKSDNIVLSEYKSERKTISESSKSNVKSQAKENSRYGTCLEKQSDSYSISVDDRNEKLADNFLGDLNLADETEVSKKSYELDEAEVSKKSHELDEAEVSKKSHELKETSDIKENASKNIDEPKEPESTKGITLKNISYQYKKQDSGEEKYAIKDISLAIEPGEFVAIIGRTGSGKSTLIQHFNGLFQPKSGDYFFNGENIWEKKYDLKKLRQKVALCFQYPEYQLFEENVLKDIAFGPKNLGFDKKECEEKARHAMQLAGLSNELEKVSPFSLSGGQKRRVALAGILAMEPEYLILDEPVAGMDAPGKKILFDLLHHLNKERGITIVLVSHNMDDVADHADRVLVMENGQLKMDGKTEEVFVRKDELTEMGLGVPQAVEFYLDLKEILEEIDIDLENAFSHDMQYNQKNREVSQKTIELSQENVEINQKETKEKGTEMHEKKIEASNEKAKEYIKTKRTKNVGIPLNIDELAAYIAGGSL
nr:energy-coupling factor transporter ATPase [uncultured Anaerobutyricum sp.]